MEIAIQRLTSWLRDYGDSKPPVFVDDISIVLMAAKDAFLKREPTVKSRDAWRKACRFMYETAGEGGRNGRPIDCYDKRTWTEIVRLIGEAEEIEA